MPFQLNEPIVTALVARLEDELPAEVDRINGAIADDFQIESPQHVYPFVPSLEAQDAFPVLGIQDLPSRFEDDTGAGVTGNHRHGIVAFVAADDLEWLAWQLRRYAQAVTNVALRGRALGDAAWMSKLERVDYGPTLESPENPRTWVSWVLVTIEFRRDEA